MKMKTKFCVVTPAYNCEDTIQQTIMSVLAQSYDAWRMIIIDDMSTDSMVNRIENIMSWSELGDKIQIIQRTEKYGETRNTLDIVDNHVEPDEVIVRLDGGDWITELDCFAILDLIYREHDPAVLWTAHRWAFTSHNISGPINHAISVYDQPWKSSHMKTFRASSMEGVNRSNFLDENGNWITIACDQAVFLPMMEKSRREGRKLIFVPQVMYHYNIDLENPKLFHNPRSYAQRDSAISIRDRGYIE